MIKKLLILILIAALVLSVSGCSAETENIEIDVEDAVEDEVEDAVEDEKAQDIDQSAITGAWTYVPLNKNIFYRLTFDGEGVVEYRAGWLSEKILDCVFDGTYTIDGSTVDIYLLDNRGDYLKAIRTILEVKPDERALTITRIGGNPLFGEEVGEPFVYIDNNSFEEFLAQRQVKAEEEAMAWRPFDDITDIRPAIIGSWVYPYNANTYERIDLFDGWRCTDRIVHRLSFHEDGSAVYVGGWHDSELFYSYEGVYTTKGSNVELNLTKITYDDEEDDGFNPATLNITLKLEPGTDSLRVTLIDGDLLMVKKISGSMIFLSQDFFYSIIGQWIY